MMRTQKECNPSRWEKMRDQPNWSLIDGNLVGGRLLELGVGGAPFVLPALSMAVSM
jgi:hypothetical protein